MVTNYTDYSWQMAIVSLLFFAAMVFIAKPWATYAAPQKRIDDHKGVRRFFFWYTLLSVFAFWEYDTYNAATTFYYYNTFLQYEIDDFEAFYNWLAMALHGNYLLWRALVWIPACYFMYAIGKRLRAWDKNLLVVVVLFGAFFAYTRGMLGHAMLLLGLVLTIDSDSHKFVKFVGLLVIFGSYFLHKSIYINMLFAIMALAPLKRKTIIISLCLFPICVTAVTIITNRIAEGDLILTFGDSVGGRSDRSQLYAAAERTVSNANGIIWQVVSLLPQYLAYAYLIKRVVFDDVFKGIEKERIYRYMFRLSYVAMYVASCFYFTEASVWIFSRFLVYVVLPDAVCIG